MASYVWRPEALAKTGFSSWDELEATVKQDHARRMEEWRKLEPKPLPKPYCMEPSHETRQSELLDGQTKSSYESDEDEDAKKNAKVSTSKDEKCTQSEEKAPVSDKGATDAPGKEQQAQKPSTVHESTGKPTVSDGNHKDGLDTEAELGGNKN
ncbi:hypothetical protein FSARC_4405 [Fusarium sarcochroum]|uniref:Uncharacterized protein n=1 Tax=Fusarium sarcochroum TaxID=1208366 RepID=A0A8H4U1J5_9HYPO|nr:hypothetical protein FSARC_4405 [Fusarium sarcochroum]